MTWANDTEVVSCIKDIMANSWQSCVDYMTPLGLHHIMAKGHHYGPGPDVVHPARKDWSSTYYHKAGSDGIGFDRSSTGTNAVAQYHCPYPQIWGQLDTCPDKYLLWFHHVPWDYRLHTGNTVWQQLQIQYNKGVNDVKVMMAKWQTLKGKIDTERYNHVFSRLQEQHESAKKWRDTCLEYFGKFAPNITLKDTYSNKFMVGTSVNLWQIQSRAPSDEMDLIKKQFNAVTAENSFKWAAIHPAPGQYQFNNADALLELAKKNKMQVIGHTLIWHEQTPDWIFNDDTGKPLNRQALLDQMKDHIYTVVGRYKGRIYGWDVVNEAIDNNGELRDTKYLQIIGPDYIQKAFEYAHQADPNAQLYYNDYNMCNDVHRQGVIRLIKQLQDSGIRIDAVGMQGHWGLDSPSSEKIQQSINELSSLGVKVMITELDITVLPSAWSNIGADISKSYDLNEKLNPYSDYLPDSVNVKLANRYKELFSIFVSNSDKISRVTFWGVQDGNSWLNNWPVRGRTNYPLMFDRDCKPKLAFFAAINAAQTK